MARRVAALAVGFGSAAWSYAGPAIEAWSALRELPVGTAWSQARADFHDVYVPKVGNTDEWVRLGFETAWIRLGEDAAGLWLELPWRSAGGGAPNFPEAEAGEPLLAGWRIALDPGHLGGAWGPVERRSFAIGDGPVVQEGDLVLAAARRLRTFLESAGAEVLLVRSEAGPVTTQRPEDFLAESFADLLGAGGELPDPAAIRREAEKRFYRFAEIEARAERVNEWKPDLVLALHLDAAAWPNPDVPSPVEVNYAHILVNGCYLDGELADSAQRQALVRRWRLGFASIEVGLATSIAESMRTATGLAPFTYHGKNAARVNDNPYVWARNLMANRLYDAPVVYLEPWVLNHREVYAWASLGDYDGEQVVAGERQASLPAVYAEFVWDGLRRWAESRRNPDEDNPVPTAQILN